jgi:hypothetical protein
MAGGGGPARWLVEGRGRAGKGGTTQDDCGGAGGGGPARWLVEVDQPDGWWRWLRQETCRCVTVPEAAVRVQDAWYMRYNAPSPGHEARMGRGNVGRRKAAAWNATVLAEATA